MAVPALQRFKKTPDQQHQHQKVNRFLITVTVLGSAGPLRFVVKEEELVSAVMETALRSYAREGRYPALGYDVNNFFLYCANAGSEALSLKEPIGSYCCRNFVLCKKKQTVEKGASDKSSVAAAVDRKGGIDCWKGWINRSLIFQ